MVNIARNSAAVLGFLLTPLAAVGLMWDEKSSTMPLEEKGFLSRQFGRANIFMPSQAGDDNTTSNPPKVGDEPSESIVTSEVVTNLTEGIDDGSLTSNSSGPSSCRITFNATAERCTRLISGAGRSDCDCYSFCGDTLAGCYAYGDGFPSFRCPDAGVVVGCHENFTDSAMPPATGIGEPCPPGFICSKYGQQSCDLVRLIPIWLGLGDVHAGLYCPGRNNRTELGYENCDVGFYCPDSTTRKPCPEGFFCPHKTVKPSITCRGCAVGATSLARESYVYTIVALVLAFMIVVVLVQAYKRYKNVGYNQLYDLHKRHLDGQHDLGYKRKHLRKLRALSPKLKLIEQRVRKQYEYNLDKSIVILREAEDGNITFDSSELFDAIDTLEEEVLSYRKLNKILKLSNVQLREFIRRMNDAAGESKKTQEVERHVFITQFLSVYAAIDHLNPSPQDAANIFDEIARQGTTITGEIPHRLFYKSLLTEFLDEEQINVMLKDFQRTKEFQEGDQYDKHDELKKNAEETKSPIVPIAFRRSFFGVQERGFSVSKSDFVARYPTLLADATKSAHSINSMVFSSQLSIHRGIDLAFDKLSVSVYVKERSIRVINSIAGRLSSGTMTALMGAPGSGKGELLAALSGRSFFGGSVSGTMLVNGHRSTLAKHSSYVGFVPRDDALYAELTVMEHLIFSAKFRLRENMAVDEIEDLVDATMATLKLSCVMHTPVGTQREGGLSPMQRKCLSIGIEIVAKPRILFLETPTQDLNATSALFIARSLKKMVQSQGITVCSSLHQPHRDCLELFDSLLLLGYGGKLVYNGPVNKVGKYFKNLNYFLHDGESFTDWVIDIATGRLPPPVKNLKGKRNKGKIVVPTGREGDSKTTETTSTSESPQLERQRSAKKVTFELAGKIVSGGGKKESVACVITKPFDTASERAKATCEMLCDHLQEHIKGLSQKKRTNYEPPQPYSLPRGRERTHFLDQLGYQVQRLLILTERNWVPRFLETTILVLAVVLITLMDGFAQPTAGMSMRDLNYESVAEPASVEVLLLEFPKLFAYATTGIRDSIEVYASKVGIIFALIVCLITTRKVIVNRPAFFREAGSGYSTGAYFLATNICDAAEHSIQAVLASLFAFSIRNSLSMWFTIVINFLVLSWVSSSWGLLFPLLIPKEHVVSVAAFFVTFFGLLFCGAIPPINYEVIYESAAAAIAASLLSPTRFFVEAMAAAEARSLPAQSGFTELGSNIRGEALEVVSFQILGYGLNDFSTITKESRVGWYWGVPASLFVGFLIRWVALGALYGTNRSKQGKKPLHDVLRQQPRERLCFLAYIVVLLGLLVSSGYFCLRRKS